MKFKLPRELKRDLNISIIPIIILGVLVNGIMLSELQKYKAEASQAEELEIPTYLTIQSNSLLFVSNFSLDKTDNHLVQEGTILVRTVTAYNPVPWETDDTPCISASGMNICQTSKKVCASNEFPFGTLLLIDGEIWEVQDRMSRKYNDRVDLFFMTKEELQKWGKRTVEVIKLN